jgi:hypothetical protein
VSAQIVTGTYNYVLRMSARDLDHYSDFLIHRLHRVSGIMTTESNIVLATVKDCGFMLDIVAFPARESLPPSSNDLKSFESWTLTRRSKPDKKQATRLPRERNRSVKEVDRARQVDAFADQWPIFDREGELCTNVRKLRHHEEYARIHPDCRSVTLI